ncbi:hypothetical protein RDWZM_008890 [Blomia tropicalis]|uniref:FYVE-type domain-containing protein n=1 Tax=Blomia tropicalis TaxID=40697 RepID=A0A9Q0RJ94_BLOTA|nr:hypothetical protein RDWZM_008890 [Blomia tropicalis]
MSSIRKWIASKMFASITSSPGNESPTAGQSVGNPIDNGLPFFRQFSTRTTNRSFPSESTVGDYYPSQMGNSSLPSIRDTTNSNLNEQTSYFSSIYSHHRKREQHLWTNEWMICNENKQFISDMYQFYYANEDLNYVSSELDTFDGRKDTDRCSALVNSLKLAQDKVITLIFRIMDEIGCERASREYRLKFPDELLAGEGVESLNSQIWFGAECLAAGSTISNNQAESNYLRPIANNLTCTLEQIRYDLRSCCDYLPQSPKISKELVQRLENFDRLFTAFEYDYVKAMLPIKPSSKEDVEGCQPSVMIALPRLSIVRGLLDGFGSVVCKLNSEDLSSILRPYHSLLLKFHEFLINLDEDEIDLLEQLLSNNYDNNDLDLSDDIFQEYVRNNGNNKCMLNDQVELLNYYNKFMKCAKKYRHISSGNNFENGHYHNSQYLTKNIETKYLKSISNNRYLSSSVDLLFINENNCTGNSNSVRYSPWRPSNCKLINRSISLPCINLNCGDQDKNCVHQVSCTKAKINSKFTSSLSSYSSPSSSSSNSFSDFNSAFPVTSSSISSLSTELDFFTQFKEILKRSHMSCITKHNNNRPFSSNFSRQSISDNKQRVKRRAKTTTGVRPDELITDNLTFDRNAIETVESATSFSNNSFHVELESIHFDELSELFICKKRILHQVFVMLSKIADKFQTNYANDLRHILRTVFILHEAEEEQEELKNSQQQLDVSAFVQLGHYSNNESIDTDIVEEGIDANEFLTIEPNIEVANRSHDNNVENETNSDINLVNSDTPINYISQRGVGEGSTSTSVEICDILPRLEEMVVMDSNSSNGVSNSNNELEVTFERDYNQKLNHTKTNRLISTSNSSIRDSICSTSSEPLKVVSSATSNSVKMDSRSLPSLIGDQSQQNAQNYNYPISNGSISSSSSSSSSISFSSNRRATQFVINRIEGPMNLPTLFMEHTDLFSSEPYYSHSMMPISDGFLDQSSASAISTGSTSATAHSHANHNLLLPPTWIPDELVSTCSLCGQVFNLIRRRHHCRRCGNIFCRQCSNHFVSLKCFGYAKPVRVCERCLVIHARQQMEQVPPNSHMASANISDNIESNSTLLHNS